MQNHDTEPISVQCTVQSEDYTIEQLEKILRVKRRQVFNYAKLICKLHYWEPEEIFKPAHGKFSTRMLAEMRELQTIGFDAYQLSVGRENHRPVALKTQPSTLAVAENCSALLDSRIANLQQSAIAESENLTDRLRASLESIKHQNVLASQQNKILDNSEQLAAQNRGYLKAIELHRIELAAKQAVLAQLRSMELEE